MTGPQAPVPQNGQIALLVRAVMLGAASGAVAALVYLAMIAVQLGLWSRLGDARWIIPVVTITGGALIGLTRLRAQVSDLETQIVQAQDPGRVHLRQTFWIALGAIIAVGFGGAIGPEAGVIAVVAQLSAWVALHLGRTEPDRRTLTAAGQSGALAGVYGSPAGGPIHAEREVSLPKPILFAAGIAGFASFIATATGIWPGVLALMHLPRLSAEGGTWDTLIAVLPAMAGAAAGGLFLWLRLRLSGLLDRHAGDGFWRPVAGGAALGLLALAMPLVLFSGHSELQEMLRIGAASGAMIFILFALAKALACAICVAAGWLGGVIYPLCFVGAAAGAAVMTVLPGIDPVLGVAAGMAAAAAVGMARPLVAGLVMLFVLGGGLAVPVFVGTLIGWAALRVIPEGLHASSAHSDPGHGAAPSVKDIDRD